MGVHAGTQRTFGINAVSDRLCSSSLVVGRLDKMIGLIVLALLGAAGKAQL